MRKLLIIIILIPFLAGNAISSDTHERFRSIGSPGLTVHFTTGLEDAARAVLNAYPTLASEASASLGITPPEGVNIIVLGEKDFRRSTFSEAIMAYANGKEKLIVMDYNALKSDPLVLGATLKHEITHLLLYSAAPQGIPRWFNEGVSQWISGGHSEVREMGPQWYVTRAALTGKLIPLASLASTFPEQDDAMRLAYSQSLSAIDYIVSTYGEHSIRDIISQLKTGLGFNDAFTSAVGLSVNAFEHNWARDISDNASMFIWLRSHLYETLFLITGIILFAGFIRTYYRIRTYKDVEDEGSVSGDIDNED